MRISSRSRRRSPAHPKPPASGARSEYVLGLSAASKGTVREIISLSFQVYDVDGTGKIDRDEMVKIPMSVADHEQK